MDWHIHLLLDLKDVVLQKMYVKEQNELWANHMELYQWAREFHN